MTLPERPRYADLPNGRVLNLFGEQEQLGCLNLLTPERVVAAARLVRTGEVFGLNAPLDYPHPFPLNRKTQDFGRGPDQANVPRDESKYRRAPSHVLMQFEHGNDDFYDGFFPQSGSQWDGFLHILDAEHGCYYNGNTDLSRGIGLWSERGIVGRGVLLDVARWAEVRGRPIDWRSSDAISVAELEQTAEAQGVSVEEGTILIVRTGWESGWNAASPELRETIAAADGFACPGVEPTREMVELLWNWGVAAVGSDNLAFEIWPPKDTAIHVDLLPRLGIPIGELWHLDALAEACDRGRRYEFLFASAPLNAPAGAGSPVNALAIL